MAPPRRILLVSSPRTASNLLLKILDLPDQPNVLSNDQGGYYFFPSFVATSSNNRICRPFDQWTEQDRADVQAAFQQSFDQLEEFTTRASQESKIFFAKEHSPWLFDPLALKDILSLNENDNHGGNGDVDDAFPFRLQIPSTYTTSPTFSARNYTIFPDEYLRTFRMTFIIRHPALMFPSFHRAMSKMLPLGIITEQNFEGIAISNMTLRFSRMLYDWCLEQNDPEARPVILDAYDVIHHPEVVAQYCDQAGLDSSKLKFEWDHTSSNKGTGAYARQRTEQRGLFNPEATKIMVSTLTGSSGLVKSKTPEKVDIGLEVAKWKDEFGEEIAKKIEQRVREAMPDYEYLNARRLVA
ncbi:hypothetical protein EYZ11_001684 [Aspergillus tanneri]|uniref:Sulfotransferase domain-containing protein n=1 Tax=Aspergillus tanneri TaxID=1220188 RepID=A0A4S3JTV3_9EURO|nr:uncharacterized protein ATNIH1004_002420 [Aspergillus tanneri]KAA8649746.1 hypothetical protein ATNIH1004_002420 [Aspergillus tanneri]THC98837.1 hypothetical protein EYZ11_001684 [Aspergillus tanneri]